MGYFVNHTTFPAFIVLSHREIAARAYEIYLRRGASEGLKVRGRMDDDTPVLKRTDRCR
jgi:Protein of unknown function (DUF2934)